MDNVRVSVKRPLVSINQSINQSCIFRVVQVSYVCLRACLKVHCTCARTSRNSLYMPSVVVAPTDLFYLLPVLLMTSFPPQRVTLRVARAFAQRRRGCRAAASTVVMNGATFLARLCRRIQWQQTAHRARSLHACILPCLC